MKVPNTFAFATFIINSFFPPFKIPSIHYSLSFNHSFVFPVWDVFGWNLNHSLIETDATSPEMAQSESEKSLSKKERKKERLNVLESYLTTNPYIR